MSDEKREGTGDARRCAHPPGGRTWNVETMNDVPCATCEAAADAAFDAECRANAGKGGFDGVPSWTWPFPALVDDEDAHVIAYERAIGRSPHDIEFVALDDMFDEVKRPMDG